MGRRKEFLPLVKEVLGEEWRVTLEEEYLQSGISGVAARWGFHPGTVWRALKSLGISRRELGGHRRTLEATLAEVERLGGVEELIKRFRTAQSLAKFLGCNRELVRGLLKESGYEYDPRRRVWRRPDDLR